VLHSFYTYLGEFTDEKLVDFRVKDSVSDKLALDT
jgi:hypothetical protein